MTWTVAIIPKDGVRTVWPIAAPLLDRAVQLSDGRWNMRALLAALLEEKSTLWVISDEARVVHAAFTTHVAHYPLRDILSCDFIGGEGLIEWLPSLSETLDRYVGDAGLSGLELYGRAGWEKPLLRLDWQKSFTGYHKLAGRQ